MAAADQDDVVTLHEDSRSPACENGMEASGLSRYFECPFSKYIAKR
jgi:hypothetical protein